MINLKEQQYHPFVEWVALDFDGVINNGNMSSLSRPVKDAFIKNRSYSKAHKVGMEESARALGQDVEWLASAFIKASPLNKEIVPFIKSLKNAGIKLSVASNNALYIIRKFLKMYKLYDYFDQIHCPDTLEYHKKPYRDYYLTLAKNLKTHPSKILFIDDLPIFIRGAKSQKFKVYWYEGGSFDNVKNIIINSNTTGKSGKYSS